MEGQTELWEVGGEAGIPGQFQSPNVWYIHEETVEYYIFGRAVLPGVWTSAGFIASMVPELSVRY